MLLYSLSDVLCQLASVPAQSRAMIASQVKTVCVKGHNYMIEKV